MTCNRKQHEKLVARPYAATLFDFFCECGGVYIPITNRVAVGDGIEIMRDFACPACATRWRIIALPEEGNYQLQQNPAMTLALSLGSQITNKLRVDQRALACASALRSYSDVPDKYPFENLFRNLFKVWKEPIEIPRNLPELIQFKIWVSGIRDEFSWIFDEEEKTGMYVW